MGTTADKGESMKVLLWIWIGLSVFALMIILSMCKLSSQIDQDAEAGLLPKPDMKPEGKCNETAK